MDESSAKPLTFLKFHQCRLLLSAGELATNTHPSVSVHYSRSALQGDGADDGEVPVSDAGAGRQRGGDTPGISDFPSYPPTLLDLRAPFAVLALPNSSLLAPGRAWGIPVQLQFAFPLAGDARASQCLRSWEAITGRN